MTDKAMTDKTTVRTASACEREAVLRIITLGFLSDPVARWIWPKGEIYLKVMPEFAQAFGGGAFDRTSADVASDLQAASLWLPPEAEPDEQAIDEIFAWSVRDDISDDLSAMFAQMDAYHPKNQPCWYLPMIAADPAFAGRGLGAALLHQGLARCDAAGQIAYLESSNPRNLNFYRRHGFELMGEIQAGSSPKMFPMVRQPNPQTRH
ncbi:MAG: N-acetyltransferase [Pseudomonadota bacterium]